MKLRKHLVEKPWGRTDIPQAFGDMGGKRIGEIWYEIDGPEQLPILVKWLFTSEKLSIQVHPNDSQARDRGMPSGKEECWYIVDAAPGATLGIGTTRPLDAEELRAASLSGSIEELMDWKPVKAGDYFYIPAGTVHAIGADITLVEVQQYADITYRLFDYGRPRELHLDDGVAVSEAQPYQDPRTGNCRNTKQLVDGPPFSLWKVSSGEALGALPISDRRWIIPLSGQISVDAARGVVGDCLLVNASHQLVFDEGASALVAW